ncbi:MAG: two pore domain potassium channel family protein [Cellulomonadaceae bacterium]|nr:two pore domain potassium channel family protein [Cellulomonadaceae bacterium]
MVQPVERPPAPERGDGRLARQLGRFFLRTTVMLAILTAWYYLLPSGGPFDDAAAGRRTGATVVMVAGFVTVLRMQLRAFRRARSVWGQVEALLTVLYLLILVFAVTYDRIAAATTDEFAGIHNRTDALYFTVTVVTTVGFGDITAVGGVGRGLVTAQMLINLVYIGTALRVLTSLRGDRTEARAATVEGAPADERDSSAPDDATPPRGRHSGNPEHTNRDT